MENNELLNAATSGVITADTSIMNAATSNGDRDEMVQTLAEAKNDSASSVVNLNAEELAKLQGMRRRIFPYRRNYTKIGRNDICPCGSGKKYKNCCLESGKYEGLTEGGKTQNPYKEEVA